MLSKVVVSLPVPAIAEVLAELAKLVPVVYQRAVTARQHKPDAFVAHLQEQLAASKSFLPQRLHTLTSHQP